MISEGSCDTELTAAENSDLPSQEQITFQKIFKLYIHIYFFFWKTSRDF